MPVVDDIDALKNAEQALRESEIRMRALLDASQDEILLVSTDGTVLAINKAARARLAKRIADSENIKEMHRRSVRPSCLKLLGAPSTAKLKAELTTYEYRNI
jgi:PAS domain-containing protein